MEAVASTGLYPAAAKTQAASEIDAKYSLLQLAARAASPQAAGGTVNRASYPQADPQQQLIYRGINNTRTTPYGQVMSYAGVSRPFESPQVIKRDDLGEYFYDIFKPKIYLIFLPLFHIRIYKKFLSLFS